MLVYAYREEAARPAISPPAAPQSAGGQSSASKNAASNSRAKTSPSAPSPSQTASAASSGVTPSAPAPQALADNQSADNAPQAPGDAAANNDVSYDVASLPAPVQRMVQQIIAAAQSGNLEAMRPVVESNDIKPLISKGATTDAIAYWKQQSADGSGRDILAAMLNIFASGFAKTHLGSETIYVWPYFAVHDLTKLTPDQQVDLYRIVSPQAAAAMIKSGKYDYYRAGITPNGVWQYFMR
jgi:hypothetical protein